MTASRSRRRRPAAMAPASTASPAASPTAATTRTARPIRTSSSDARSSASFTRIADTFGNVLAISVVRRDSASGVDLTVAMKVCGAPSSAPGANIVVNCMRRLSQDIRPQIGDSASISLPRMLNVIRSPTPRPKPAASCASNDMRGRPSWSDGHQVPATISVPSGAAAAWVIPSSSLRPQRASGATFARSALIRSGRRSAPAGAP